MNKLREIDPRWKANALAGCVCVLFYVCVTHLGSILSGVATFLGLFRTVFIGAVIAYIVYPLARFFDRRVLRFLKNDRYRWILSVVLTLLAALTFLFLLLASMLPQLVASIRSLLDNIGIYVDGLTEYADSLKSPGKELVGRLTQLADSAEDPFERLGTLIADNLSDIVTATSSIGSRAVSGGIGAIIAVYLLLAREPIKNTFCRLLTLLLKPAAYRHTTALTGEFNRIFSKYIICELLDSLIIGGLNFLFMLLLKMPNALVISVLAGVTNLVPTFGPVIGAAIGGFILLLVSPGDILPFLVFTAVLQSADGYVIKPRLFGGALNVPGVLILIAIIVFGKLWGVMGMLIAIPAAAILVYLYSQILIPWLEQRRSAE